MKLDTPQISALTAVLREGSFEKAAASLHVTPSAISQRIRALEERTGTILIIRDTPCRPTAEGARFYRYALQMELLEHDLMQDMRFDGKSAPKIIPVAVNTDTLATWFADALALFTTETGQCMEIFVDDQEHTAAWLKEGRVLGAVTSLAKPVQGCRIDRLGSIRYIPMASPDFVKRYFRKGLTKENLQLAPMLVFDRKDRLQHQVIQSITRQKTIIDPPCHFIPSSHIFQDAAAMGLGWGVVPEALAQDYLKRKTLVNIAPGHELTVNLYWQCWRLTSPTLDTLTDCIKRTAKRNLA